MPHFEEQAEKQPATSEQASEQLSQEAVKDAFSKPGNEGTFRPQSSGAQNDTANKALPGLEIGSAADPGAELHEPAPTNGDNAGKGSRGGSQTPEMQDRLPAGGSMNGGKYEEGTKQTGRGQSGGGKGLENSGSSDLKKNQPESEAHTRLPGGFGQKGGKFEEGTSQSGVTDNTTQSWQEKAKPPVTTSNPVDVPKETAPKAHKTQEKVINKHWRQTN